MTSQIQVGEMSSLCRVAGLSLKDRVRSSDIREGLRVELFLCFGHAQSGARLRGRPRTHWRHYISGLSWEHLGTVPEELAEVLRDKGSLCFPAETATPETQSRRQRRQNTRKATFIYRFALQWWYVTKEERQENGSQQVLDLLF